MFSKLKSYGTELVFFFDGTVQAEKRNHWMNNAKEADEVGAVHKSKSKVTRLVRQGTHTVKSILDSSKQTGCDFKYNQELITVIKASCEKFGRVFSCQNYECDREISCFVLRNLRKVIGVFSDDSDFLIFPGSWRYFSTKHIVADNQGTLTTKEYPRQGLRKVLRLNDLQLAVLATLCGNDTMQSDHVQIFHEDNYVSFFKTAELVRKCITKKKAFSKNIDLVFDDFMDQLGIHNEGYKIAVERIEHFRDNFLISIKFYICNYDLNLTSSEEYYNELAYQIANRHNIPIFAHFFDMEGRKFDDFWNLFIPRLQRQAGVVMQIKSMNDNTFSVLTRLKHENNCRIVPVDPVFPPFRVSEQLMAQYDINQKFEILKWMSQMDNIENFDLGIFSDNYIVGIITMFHLLSNGVITWDELELLLWTIIACDKKIIDRCLPVDENRLINPRAFSISHLYLRSYIKVLSSVEICGLGARLWVSYIIQIS